MAKNTSKRHKYRYNPITLNYERINLKFKDYLKRVMIYLLVSVFFAGITMVIAYNFFDSPKEVQLKREIKQLNNQYELLNQELAQVEEVLSDVRHRDDNIYRVIFEADPISDNVRKAGIGGVNRYKKLDGYQFTDLVKNTRMRLDNISKQLVVQSKSFDDVIKLARNKEQLLASIPAIQPIANKDLKTMTSGFGYRIHPIYKTAKMHTGMDFAAPTGSPVYATGEGTIRTVESSHRGYGNNIIIDHGYGYQTLYAHLSSFASRPGQQVKRGDIIGYVGSTGQSTAPHLHYEVHKDRQRIDPINFFFNDLTPMEYEKMIELSANANQSFD
ncbi:MAG: M23 family metallopeptidase [Bacteroidota bacterium]